MKRFQVFTLFFLFSAVVVSVFVMDASAQADPEEVQQILAQIDDLENKRAVLVRHKAEYAKDQQRLNEQLRSLYADILDTIQLISQLEAELAMAQGDADRRRWQQRLQQAKARLTDYQNKFYSVLDKKTMIEYKIHRLEKRIAEIDNDLMSLYARLFALL